MDINTLISKLKRIKKYHFPDKELVRVLFIEEKLREMNYVPKPGNGDFQRSVTELCPGHLLGLYDAFFSNAWFTYKWLQGVFCRFDVHSVGIRWFPLTNNCNFDGADVVCQMLKINDLISEWNKEFNGIWNEKCDTLQHELQKYDKTKQIGINTAVAFTKCRMRELGCEYQLNGDLLEIKLLYDRKLAVRLPDTNMAKVKRILNHLPQHIAAINSVPAEYEIKSLSRTDMRSVGQATPEVACRMKQMGYNYSCYYDFPTTKSNKFELLEVIVQLPKKRELVLWKSKTQKPTDKILDEMPANIDAINSLPFYFRIRPVLSCDKWEKSDG